MPCLACSMSGPVYGLAMSQPYTQLLGWYKLFFLKRNRSTNCGRARRARGKSGRGKKIVLPVLYNFLINCSPALKKKLNFPLRRQKGVQGSRQRRFGYSPTPPWRATVLSDANRPPYTTLPWLLLPHVTTSSLFHGICNVSLVPTSAGTTSFPTHGASQSTSYFPV